MGTAQTSIDSFEHTHPPDGYIYGHYATAKAERMLTVDVEARTRKAYDALAEVLERYPLRTNCNKRADSLSAARTAVMPDASAVHPEAHQATRRHTQSAGVRDDAGVPSQGLSLQPDPCIIITPPITSGLLRDGPRTDHGSAQGRVNVTALLQSLAERRRSSSTWTGMSPLPCISDEAFRTHIPALSRESARGSGVHSPHPSHTAPPDTQVKHAGNGISKLALTTSAESPLATSVNVHVTTGQVHSSSSAQRMHPHAERAPAKPSLELQLQAHTVPGMMSASPDSSKHVAADLPDQQHFHFTPEITQYVLGQEPSKLAVQAASALPVSIQGMLQAQAGNCQTDAMQLTADQLARHVDQSAASLLEAAPGRRPQQAAITDAAIAAAVPSSVHLKQSTKLTVVASSGSAPRHVDSAPGHADVAKSWQDLLKEVADARCMRTALEAQLHATHARELALAEQLGGAKAEISELAAELASARACAQEAVAGRAAAVAALETAVAGQVSLKAEVADLRVQYAHLQARAADDAQRSHALTSTLQAQLRMYALAENTRAAESNSGHLPVAISSPVKPTKTGLPPATAGGLPAQVQSYGAASMNVSAAAMWGPAAADNGLVTFSGAKHRSSLGLDAPAAPVGGGGKGGGAFTKLRRSASGPMLARLNSQASDDCPEPAEGTASPSSEEEVQATAAETLWLHAGQSPSMSPTRMRSPLHAVMYGCGTNHRTGQPSPGLLVQQAWPRHAVHGQKHHPVGLWSMHSASAPVSAGVSACTSADQSQTSSPVWLPQHGADATVSPAADAGASRLHGGSMDANDGHVMHAVLDNDLGIDSPRIVRQESSLSRGHTDHAVGPNGLQGHSGLGRPMGLSDAAGRLGADATPGLSAETSHAAASVAASRPVHEASAHGIQLGPKILSLMRHSSVRRHTSDGQTLRDHKHEAVAAAAAAAGAVEADAIASGHNMRIDVGDCMQPPGSSRDEMAVAGAVERMKQAGNRAFHSQQYTMAVHYYDEAMQALQHEHQNGIGSSNSSSFSNNGSTSMVVLLCNRAASYLCLSCPLEALADSCTACELSAKQACLRAWQRRSNALAALGCMSAAADAMQRCLLALHAQQADTHHSSDPGATAQVALIEQELSRLRAVSVGPYAAALVDHYTVLGVGQQAGGQEVRAAYRRLALKWHPDKAPSPARAAAARVVWQLLCDAHAVLGDASTRRTYDVTHAKANLLAMQALGRR